MTDICPGSLVKYSRKQHGIAPHVGAIEAEPAVPLGVEPGRAARMAGHADTAAKAAHGLWEYAVRRAFIADLSKGTLFSLFTIVREDLPARFHSGLHEVGLRGSYIAVLPVIKRNGTHMRPRKVDDVAMAMKEAKRAGGVHVAEAAMAVVVATTGSIATAGRKWRFKENTINAHLQPQWSFLGRLAHGSRLHAYPGLHHIGVVSSMSREIPALFRHLFEATIVNWELPHARTKAGAEAFYAAREQIRHTENPGYKVNGPASAIVHEIGNMSVADLSRKTTQAIQQFYSVDVACITHIDSPG